MEFVHEGVEDVLLRKQQTQQKLATLMGVLKTTVQCWIVASTIHVHSNSLKPILTEENKLARLLMANHIWDPNLLGSSHKCMCQICQDQEGKYCKERSYLPNILYS